MVTTKPNYHSSSVTSVNQSLSGSATRAEMETSLLGFGPAWWNVAMLVMLGVVILAVCLLAVAATGVIMLQRRENAVQAMSLEEYKLEAAQKIER